VETGLALSLALQGYSPHRHITLTSQNRKEGWRNDPTNQDHSLFRLS